MYMDKDSSSKDRMRKVAAAKARKKGKMDPEAQPGFKPRPFLEKFKPTKMIMTKEMRKGMPPRMRKLKDK
jgi:hypothetical protein